MSTGSSAHRPPGSVVIVGAGQAGWQTAESLRRAKYQGSVTLLTEEPGLPYQRPPLSKGYLLGDVDARRLLYRQEKWYDTQRVDLVHSRAVSVDRAAHTVRTEDGTVVPYEHLVLATGARGRTLPVEGADLSGVHGMRTREDADALAGLLRPGARAVVVGAGFIGLEFAAVAAARGVDVHVLEFAERPMSRALTAATAALFRQAHEERGVRFDFGCALASIEGDTAVDAVTTSDGRSLPADLVVYGIGVVPNTELAQSCGLAVDDGILVDSTLLTEDPDVSALGDAVRFPCAAAQGAPTRLESVQNAADQARHVAARLTGGEGASAYTALPYTALPWFWSDQGDLHLQIAGLSTGCDRVVDVPGVGEDEKVVLCFTGERLVAVETVNRPADHMAARRLLAVDGAPRTALTPEVAEEPGFDLVAWEAAVTREHPQAEAPRTTGVHA
ncbi:NAD(P)/FAD-dependent oxidoreductase [Brevibacterium litoralis]|uniref:NAD(P)/FAD-dependent oxidoreductase n=1 Tax=Brevibacterium litoralis TaxID=3138935 RepID=UPI0032EB966E